MTAMTVVSGEKDKSEVKNFIQLGYVYTQNFCNISAV